WHSELHLLCFFRTTQQVREPCKHALPCEFASDPLDVYFFLPDPKFGCQPAAAPFWLGAAAIVLTFSFFGFLDSRLPFCSPLAMPLSLGWVTGYHIRWQLAVFCQSLTGLLT